MQCQHTWCVTCDPMHRMTCADGLLCDHGRRLPAGSPQRFRSVSSWFPSAAPFGIVLSSFRVVVCSPCTCFVFGVALPFRFSTRSWFFSHTREVRHNGHFEVCFTFLLVETFGLPANNLLNTAAATESVITFGGCFPTHAALRRIQLQ